MAQGINFTVIDKHGDMDSLGDIAEYRFGYGFNRGINPLTVHPDIEYGGPEASATAFGSLLNDLSGVHRLGPEQQSMLHHAIMDLYYANKIYQDKPESWQKPSFPDLRDLERFLVFKYKKLLIGGDKESKEETDCLQSLYKDKRALEKLEKAKAQGAEVDAKIDDKIASLVGKYEDYLRKGILNDRDFLIYTSQRGLLGIRNRIQNLNNSRVFVKDEVSLKNARINIKLLDDEQKRLVAYYVLRRLLHAFLRASYTPHVRHYIVIDECSFFLESPKIAQQIVKIVQEGRKFGLGIILATQNPLRFSTDILLNTATKAIFAVEPIVYKNVSKAFGIEETYLSSVVPRKNCLYSTRTTGNGKYDLVVRDIS
jgi:hypothetical protein